MNDYYLWKSWWYAAIYGASPQMRMKMLDDMRIR